MDKIFLSKSQFTRGLQCHKSLWLYKYNPELRAEPDAATQARFEAGTEVGILAHQIFPGGKLIAFDRSQFAEKIKETQAAIEAGVKTIYEATFSYDDILVMVDILRKGRQSWEIYEVKSSNSLKEEYLPDAAIQYYVLTGAGIEVSRIALVHLNGKYIRQGDIDVKDLFVIEDITGNVRDSQTFVKEQIKKQRIMLDGGTPNISIGPQCESPYPCDFSEYCWKHIPDDSVFDLRERGVDKYKLYRQGIIMQKDIPLDILNNKQRFQVESTLKRQDTVDKTNLAEFLRQLTYPVCYLDFETFMMPIPPFDGTSPWQQIPFQFALYLQPGEGTKLEYYEFLGTPSLDPQKVLLESLLKTVPTGACMVAYNAAFEIRILKALALSFPKHVARINNIIEHFVDLMEPFKKRYIYYWQVKGSYSLKEVLPALVPKMSYVGMDISDGNMASHAYLEMGKIEDGEGRRRIRTALLEYCKQDTLGMVELVNKIKTLIE